jgi:hypothetical protein
MHYITPLFAGIVDDKREGFAFRTGKDTRSVLRIRGLVPLLIFSAVCWIAAFGTFILSYGPMLVGPRDHA